VARRDMEFGAKSPICREAIEILRHWLHIVEGKLSTILPVFVRVGRAERIVEIVRRQRGGQGWAFTLVSGYKVVVGRYVFGIVPFMWNGIDTIDRNSEKQAIGKHQRGGKINIGLAPLERDFRWRMKRKMQVQNQIAMASAYLQENK
jgi:hypothetical protein